VSTPTESPLLSAATEIEAHLAGAGWDRPPALFALVRAGRFAADDPGLARTRGIDSARPDTLVPVEQEPLPDGPLDEALAHIEWPPGVVGCALGHEVVMLPPDAEDDTEPADATAVLNHPGHREARLVVAVLRDGGNAAVLRVRGTGGEDDSDLLRGPDLAPDLADALRATLH
jgi:hypothetical protein